MTKKVVILGGHGDGLVASQIISDLRRAGESIELVGFLNDGLDAGQSISGVPVLGKTSEWYKFNDVYFHCCLLSVGKMQERSELISGFNIPEKRLISLIHPTAMISDDCEVGAGSLIAAYAVCQPQVKIGRFCSIRAGANLGHDASLADFSYVGPNATLCGYSTLARGAYVAPNAVVRDRISMGKYSVLAAGAVAFKNLPDVSTWIGNPARRAV